MSQPTEPIAEPVTEPIAALLDRARQAAVSTRDRQVVAIAAAVLRGDDDLAQALAADHLADHPESPVTALLDRSTATSTQTTSAQTTSTPSINGEQS